MRVSVSNLDLYRSYRDDDEFPTAEFLLQLSGERETTEAMLRGRAFAKAMEHVSVGESETLEADGYVFAMVCDAEIPLWKRREIKAEKDYGGVVVSARCDRIMGRIIADDKTTERFDPEKYMAKYQWRYYLDMFGADRFDWHIWEVNSVATREVEVRAHHVLSQYRYPGMEDDCRELAQDFLDFAKQIGWEGRKYDNAK